MMIEPQADLEPKVMGVRITNLNDFDLTDMFDGTEYTIPALGHLSMPIDAAYHIFGWHPPVVDDQGKWHECEETVRRTHCYKRFGWNTPALMGRAHIFYDNIKIQPIKYRMIPVEVDKHGNAIEHEAVEVPAEAPAPSESMQGAVPPPARAPKSNRVMLEAASAAANR